MSAGTNDKVRRVGQWVFGSHVQLHSANTQNGLINYSISDYPRVLFFVQQDYFSLPVALLSIAFLSTCDSSEKS